MLWLYTVMLAGPAVEAALERSPPKRTRSRSDGEWGVKLSRNRPWLPVWATAAVCQWFPLLGLEADPTTLGPRQDRARYGQLVIAHIRPVWRPTWSTATTVTRCELLAAWVMADASVAWDAGEVAVRLGGLPARFP